MSRFWRNWRDLGDGGNGPPLVKGGQGRTGDDLIASAACLSWLILMVITSAAIGTVMWRCSS